MLLARQPTSLSGELQGVPSALKDDVMARLASSLNTPLFRGPPTWAQTGPEKLRGSGRHSDNYLSIYLSRPRKNLYYQDPEKLFGQDVRSGKGKGK